MSLVIALILDAVFGEPEKMWNRVKHPAVLIGEIVAFLERHLNIPPNPRAFGVMAIFLLASGALILGYLVSLLPLSWLWQGLIAATLIAQKSLVDHVGAVADALDESVEKGREAVSHIVGRDVSALDEAGVARAGIESAAENMSDGVVAPVFWFVIAGLPGLLLYKAVNTADSMVGYRTERLEAFGWASAKLDDLLNWVPARLTAFLILVSQNRFEDWSTVRRDGPLHRSPNAGWPEAAMAIVLDTPLSGPRSYEGQVEDYPWVYPEGEYVANAFKLDQACDVLWRVWAILLGFAGVWALLGLILT